MTPGTQLGTYEILSPLGKGGMGEVWRARDSKLGREVAIKTLPEEFAKDDERLARFEREAKLLASLNHPNIAAIYGLEEHESTRFLVLELVEGDTLAERLKRGAIPIEESLKLALQIAEALEAAHEKGVIHRDLKPANIKVTPDGKVKVLDFGLAKAFAGDGADIDLSKSPTLSMAATQQGVILGTAAYMSPEQARGEATDKRADVWAFGVVLFEMLTGTGTFDGRTVSDVLAGVLAKEPQWNTLPLNLHPRIRLLLERCLEKEAKDRYHDIADVRVDIQKVLADPNGVIVQPVAEVVQAAPRSILTLVAAVVIAAAIGAIATLSLQPDPPDPPSRTVVRFSHALDEGQVFTSTVQQVVEVSPDGSSIAYVANGQLWLREIGSEEARPVPGTQEDPFQPLFSPDGQWIAYWASNQLKKVQIAGGTPVPLWDGTGRSGSDWVDNTIYFGQQTGITAVSAIMAVSANGGTPEVVLEGGFAPRMLPGGNALLFYRLSADASSGGQIWVHDLETREETLLVEDGRAVWYASSGHLVYYLNQTIFAVPFDAENLTVTGGPVSLIENVSRIQGSPVPHFSLSNNGTAVYLSGGVSSPERRLVWLDRDGSNEVPVSDVLADYDLPRISPDGTRVAVGIREADGIRLWVYDLERESRSQFTFEGRERVPVWTRDGSRIAFFSGRQLPADIYWKLADGSGEAELLLEQDSNVIPVSWTPDDSVLAYFIIDPKTRRDIWTIEIDDGAVAPEPFLVGPPDEKAPAFSPDGNWIAYVSDESGQDEIWVRPYPRTDGGQRRISTESGVEPVWSRDGRELFFRTIEGDMMAVQVDVAGGFTFEPPRRLFDGQMYMNLDRASQRGVPTYDVHPNGDRFLMVRDPEEQISQEIHVVVNWFEELAERVPVP